MYKDLTHEYNLVTTESGRPKALAFDLSHEYAEILDVADYNNCPGAVIRFKGEVLFCPNIPPKKVMGSWEFWILKHKAIINVAYKINKWG